MMAIVKQLAWPLLISVTSTFFCLPAYAIDLNGAWATDPSVCARVFLRKDGNVTFQPDSDQYGGGFIVEGDYIRGQLQKCKINSRKEVAGTIHLLASCATDIMFSNMQFSVKIVDENNIVRVFPDMPDMSLPFARCSF
jgi:hypothetical protein